MVNSSAVVNGTAIVSEVSALLFHRFEWLYGVLRGIGVLLLLYLLYLLFNIFTQNKMKRRVKRIGKKVEVIDSKLDLLILKLIDDSSKKSGTSRRESGGKRRVSKK
jgi:pilus assembly protein TadC